MSETPQTAEEDQARQRHLLTADLHTYVVPVSPKMLLETLCVVEFALNELERQRPGFNAGGRIESHQERVRALMDECSRKRPTGPDGKHDSRHTTECGCADNPLNPAGCACVVGICREDDSDGCCESEHCPAAPVTPAAGGEG